jgi:hypothetical protein
MDYLPEMTPLGMEKITPKGDNNPYGSVTGPYNTAGGWGKPATKGEPPCPKCRSVEFHYKAMFAAAAENVCPECGYSEIFCY